MTVKDAEEKRKTCKLCQRKSGFSFCKRHSPKVTMKKVLYRPLTYQECVDRVLKAKTPAEYKKWDDLANGIAEFDAKKKIEFKLRLPQNKNFRV